MTRLLVDVGAGLSLVPGMAPWLSLMPGVMLRHCCLVLCPLDMGELLIRVVTGHPSAPLQVVTNAQVPILTFITIHVRFESSTLLQFNNRITWSQNKENILIFPKGHIVPTLITIEGQ